MSDLSHPLVDYSEPVRILALEDSRMRPSISGVTIAKTVWSADKGRDRGTVDDFALTQPTNPRPAPPSTGVRNVSGHLEQTDTVSIVDPTTEPVSWVGNNEHNYAFSVA